MKKYIPLILTIMNIVIILLLLFLSICVLYFNLNSRKEIFHHSAVLYQSQDDNSQEDTLLLIISTDNHIKIGDEVLYNNDITPRIDSVADIVDDGFILEKSESLGPISLAGITGVVKFQSAFWGNLLVPLTTQSGLITAIVIIVAGFLILTLSIIFIYLKKHAKNNSAEDDAELSELIEEIESKGKEENQKEEPKETTEATEDTVVVEQKTNEPVTPRSSSRTPLIASRFPDALRNRPNNIGNLRYTDRSTFEPVTQEIEYDEVKIHEFDTVEELFLHYHTNELEIVKPEETTPTEIPQNHEPSVETPIEEPKAVDSTIDSLLNEIMKQAEEEYIKEHNDAEIQKYLS